MPRLIWVFAGRTVTLLVLSCRGSFLETFHIILIITSTRKLFWFLFIIRLEVLAIDEKQQVQTNPSLCQNNQQPPDKSLLSEQNQEKKNTQNAVRGECKFKVHKRATGNPFRCQQRLWSDWADTQADLSSHFCSFCHVLTQVCIIQLKNKTHTHTKKKQKYKKKKTKKTIVCAA